MADLAAEAGAGTELVQYLEDRGVRAPATLALLAQDDHELETVLLQPLLTGWKTKAGSAITLAESEKPIAKAILRHMWNLARNSWQAQLSAARPATSPAPDPASATSSGSSTKDDKVPKTLPAGVWSKAIQAYESQQIGGCDRTFPTHELLGAESVLARIHHEITISKLFTPVALGEILQKRTFQASGRRTQRSGQKGGQAHYVHCGQRPTDRHRRADVATEELAGHHGWAGVRQMGIHPTSDWSRKECDQLLRLGNQTCSQPASKDRSA